MLMACLPSFVPASRTLIVRGRFASRTVSPCSRPDVRASYVADVVGEFVVRHVARRDNVARVVFAQDMVQRAGL